MLVLYKIITVGIVAMVPFGYFISEMVTFWPSITSIGY
jgi:hypothetical protein